jgi:nitroreductase
LRSGFFTGAFFYDQMDTSFLTISGIIKNRRSSKPFDLNGEKIPNEQISELLQLADWAPTHGYTEPWRFVVYENPPAFCQQHASLYKQFTPADKFEKAKFEKLLHQGDKASHIIVAVMQRGNLPKIPALEEIAATSCAIQNLLLGATALEIASLWSTGGMALKPQLRDWLGYGEHDLVMGILYLGYSGKSSEATRMIPIEQKIRWVK